MQKSTTYLLNWPASAQFLVLLSLPWIAFKLDINTCLSNQETILILFLIIETDCLWALEWNFLGPAQPSEEAD